MIPTFIVRKPAASRTGNGEFHIELLKTQSPGSSAVYDGRNPVGRSHEIKHRSRFASERRNSTPDFALWKLIEESMLRGHPTLDSATIPDNPHHGCSRFENGTYLWFAWPNVPNAQEGADADTGKPLQ